MFRKPLCLLFIFAALIVSDDASANDYSTYRKELKDRQDGFFEHLKKQKLMNQEILSGVKELKKERQKSAELKELARKRFHPKTKKNEERLKVQWEKKQQSKQKKYLQIQKQYAKEKERLENLKNKDYKIPEQEEFNDIYR